MQENLGTVMVFTLHAAICEWLETLCNTYKERAQQQIEEELEKKREKDRSLVRG